MGTETAEWLAEAKALHTAWVDVRGLDHCHACANMDEADFDEWPNIWPCDTVRALDIIAAQERALAAADTLANLHGPGVWHIAKIVAARAAYRAARGEVE